MMSNFRLFILCCLISSLSSCNTRLDDALMKAGDNRMELEKVLEHFRHSSDELKYEAAKFLIENMPFHCTYEGPTTETFDSLYLRAAMEPIDNRTLFFNQKSEALDDGQTVLVSDITNVTADYLITMINYACDVWQATGWHEIYDKSIFFEYVLPYRLNNELLSNWHKAISEEYPLLKADYMVSRRGVQIEAEKGICDFCEVKDAIGASQHEAVILHSGILSGQVLYFESYTAMQEHLNAYAWKSAHPAGTYIINSDGEQHASICTEIRENGDIRIKSAQYGTSTMNPKNENYKGFSIIF